MYNYWLNRLKVGTRVCYTGIDPNLWGKYGRILRHLGNGNIDIEFEFLGLFTTTRIVTVHRSEITVL